MMPLTTNQKYALGLAVLAVIGFVYYAWSQGKLNKWLPSALDKPGYPAGGNSAPAGGQGSGAAPPQ